MGESYQDRPLGVTVLALLATIPFVFGLFAVMGALGGGGGSPILLLLPAIAAVAAYGLWFLRPWGWILAVILWALATADAVLQLIAGAFNTNLVVGPLVLLYLMRPQIRAAFRR